MFKKKPTLKPVAPIRSSDRRKIAGAFVRELHLKEPDIAAPEPTADGDATEAPSEEGSQKSFINSLLPDGATSAKFSTTVGPELRNVTGNIYFGNADDSSKKAEQKPLWVKSEDDFPTVYTLWRHPDILPIIHTHPPVMEKIYNGADLMVPGIVPPVPENAKRGRLVGIATTAAPGLPLAVGVAEIDLSVQEAFVGEKGKAVRMLHWYGDEIWKLGGSGSPPSIDINGTGLAEVEQKVEELALAEQEQGEQGAEPAVDISNEQLSIKEIDSAFYDAALYGIKHLRETGATNLDYPLTASGFISQLVTPFLPPASQFNSALPSDVVHPALHMKKTSWKNAGKFMKHLDKRKIIKTKTRNGNEVVVLDIDWDDEEVIKFTPYKLPVVKTDTSAKPSSSTATTTSSTKEPVKVVELFKPMSKLSPIFEAIPADKHSYHTASSLRSLIDAYIEKEGLVNPKNKRLASLNPIIANTLLNERDDAAALAAGSIKRDELAAKFVSLCSPYYVVLAKSEDFDPKRHKAKSGKPPRVQILLEKRQGKKTVTRVWNLEPFGVVPGELADELSKACASSTSVNPVVGVSPKDPKFEVMVQGNQKAAVEKALQSRGVEGRWIETVDKTGKK